MAGSDRFRLDGKVAVLTGGTGLFGKPFGVALADAGAQVVITSRHGERAEATARLCAQGGLPVVGRALDQGNPASIKEFADTIGREFGRIDVLVNNAVHRQGSGFTETSGADWDATSAVNSRGLFLLTQALVPLIPASGGSIVNIGSIYGIVGPTLEMYNDADFTSPAFYAYDKAGMIGFTRYLANALGSNNIRVNCLCPGGFNSRAETSPFIEAYSARTPLGRMATADDVTGALVFLASDAARYITGVTLPVDGGWTAK